MVRHALSFTIDGLAVVENGLFVFLDFIHCLALLDPKVGHVSFDFRDVAFDLTLKVLKLIFQFAILILKI